MNRSAVRADHVALFVYYFPPLSSSGAKRMEALAKYFSRAGRRVSVITQTKSERDGPLTEIAPPGVTVYELDAAGRLWPSPPHTLETSELEPSVHTGRVWRGLRDAVLRTTGQLIDPRMPFALSLGYPWLAPEVQAVLRSADVMVGTCPPWPPLLAALTAGARFGAPTVLDFRDQLSCCHEMPGSRLAKRLEISLDKYLVSRAESVVTISEPMRRYYGRFHDDVVAILNGYDEEQLDAARARSPWRRRAAKAPMRIRYLGVITKGRLPHNLLQALQAMHTAAELVPGSIMLEFYGDCALLQALVDARYPELSQYFRFYAAVPYSRALELVVSADHLLFCERMVPPLPGQEASAEGILPTKLYEYLASERPVLGNLPPANSLGEFIGKAGPQHFVSGDTSEFLAYMRSDAFWNPPQSPVNEFVRSLSREAQAHRYLAHLDRVVMRMAAKER